LTTYNELLQRLDRVLGDDSDLLDNEERKVHFQDAVTEHSQHRPQPLVQKYDGTGEYDYDVPTYWDYEFSRITKIEYPVGYQYPSFINLEEVSIYHNGTAYKLRFLSKTPAAAEDFIVYYTAIHVCTDGRGSTIAEADEYAVVNLAASRCCGHISRKLAQSADGRDPNIMETNWIWRSVVRLRDQAESLAETYYQHVGGKKPIAAARRTSYAVPSWGSYFNRG
jgi:hypothetical protein